MVQLQKAEPEIAMEGNIPQSAGKDPVSIYAQRVDLSEPETRVALFELLQGEMFTEDDLKVVVDRIDPNVREQMTFLMGILHEETPVKLMPYDYDIVAGKIDPNSVIGSYAILVLLEQEALSENAKHAIRQRIDPAKVANAEHDSEFGSALSNLVEAELVTIGVVGRFSYPDFRTDSPMGRYN